MDKITPDQYTPACILHKFRQSEMTHRDVGMAESDTKDLLATAQQISDRVWQEPIKSQGHLRRCAAIAAFHNGAEVDQDGNIILPDLDSNDRGKRAVAELIMAAFAAEMAVVMCGPYIFCLVA